MSTRSNIGIVNDDGSIDFIYCHSDGYPSYNGRILLEHYTDREKVRKLVNLGDISSLGQRVEPLGAHSFNARERGTTVAYMRDRGEDGCGFRTVAPVAGSPQFSRVHQQEYAYILTDDGWLWCAHDGNFKPLTAADCE